MTQSHGSRMTTAGSPRPLLPGPPHIAITNHDKFVKEQGRSPGSARTPKPSAWKDARPAPRRTRVPTTLAGRGGRCATCYGLERLAAKLAARSPCLECHQSFLLCVLDSGQGSRGSCGLGRTVCTSRAGRPLPLRGPRPLGREHTPISRGSRDTPLPAAKQHQADLYEYAQGPGILARLPHNIRSIIGGRGAAVEVVQLPEEPECAARAVQVLIAGIQRAWDRVRHQHRGGTGGLAPSGEHCGPGERWGAQVPLLGQWE